MALSEQKTLRRRAIEFMETAGLRGILGHVGTHVARRVTNEDVELFFDEIWIRRVGDNFFGDKDRFDYFRDEFKVWNSLHRIWLDDPIDFWLYKYQPAEGDVIIDIGAGFGNDALIFSRRVGGTGRVVAVEAHPVAFRKLLKTCKWSKLDNVTPISVAVGAENGSAWISGDTDWVGNSIAPSKAKSSSGFKVPIKRFDDIAQELGLQSIALIKMNIEGAERDALKGMSRTLSMTSAVVIACHDFRAEQGEGEYFRTKSIVAEFLMNAGFHLQSRDDDPRPYVRDTLYGVKRGVANH